MNPRTDCPNRLPAHRSFLPFATVFTALLFIAGCTQSVGVAPPTTDAAGQQGDTAEGFTRFPDMPLPLKSSLDLDRTMVFGASEAWIGRLALTASFDPGPMFEFYRQQMPQFGWQEITSLRSAVSVLTYARDSRVATIQIQKRTISGSDVTITVSPRGSSGAGMTSTPAPVAGPSSRSVGSSPLPPPPGAR